LRIAPTSFAFTALLGLFAALPALSIDVSAPTLALLPHALDTSRTVAGLTLSLFMVGFALGQLGGGSLSDGYGRRPVLLGGLANFTLAGIACGLSLSGEVLAISRLVQGFGAGVCSVIAFAMVQDLFEGDAARAKRSYVTTIFAIVPILAPALGSLLTDLFGWRSVHWVLALGGGSLFAFTWAGVAESRQTGLTIFAGGSRSIMVRLWNDPPFVRITLANAFSYGAIFAYIAGSPVVVMGQMGYSSAVFAAVFACTAAALAAGAWTNGRLTRRGIGAAALIGPSLFIAAIATLAVAILSLFESTAGAFLIPLLLAVFFTRGITAPNLQHLAIERQRERAGSASAAVGVSQLLSGALASAVVALLLQYLGPGAVAVPMAMLAVSAFIVWHRSGVSGRRSVRLGARE
jgi:DHA1 family bicyclomycin/chloramphenicol resistance-like MFS transporter